MGRGGNEEWEGVETRSENGMAGGGMRGVGIELQEWEWEGVGMRSGNGTAGGELKDLGME